MLLATRPQLLLLVTSLVIAPLQVGCLKEPQFHLEVPERTAPLPDRVAAFERLEPQIVHGTEIYNSGSIGGRHLEFVDSLELADGTLIHAPEVLRQAVLPGSYVDLLIDDYVALRRQGYRMAWVGRGVGLTAVPLGIGAIVADGRTEKGLAYASLGAFVTWIVLRLINRSVGQRRERAQSLVFSSFRDGLLERLALCPTEGGTLRDCPLSAEPPAIRLRLAR